MNDDINFTVYLNEYHFPEPYEVNQRDSGMNNTTRVILSGNERYAFRIYNNHKDVEIVRLEQEVLSALAQQSLPFQIPVPVRNKRGDTLSIAEDGTLSALFHYIDGDRPTASNPEHVYALGQIAALLANALESIKPDRLPLYSPYYELEYTYAAMDEAAFLSMADRSDALRARSINFEYLQRERNLLKEVCVELEGWPKQWIHGDLVFNNTVSRENAIIGVLDFEFATMDVRAMELAVIIVDLLKPEDAELKMKIQLLVNGYKSICPLTAEELQLLPRLMKLRLLDVALHFAVRFRDQLDKDDVLCQIVDQSAFGCKWITENWEDGIT
ncbi:homoserine kinase type II [Paenibacillus endophyticus]|uniref:Homoserine kinase type II n=1 Tax=Paenibacillus endophyticus TaxID=1294268 RepID=A0A7W5C5L0_9BACL|nr:phosphotransferase [Paenibacillus endophyticus]MBB3151607.1 homoserine kinase type II [Paenibacillus endophyticus]